MKPPVIASVYPFPGNADFCHDVNFSLIQGDKIYSAEEAKFSTVTNDYVSRYPERAMARGFMEANISPEEVDFWVFGQPVNVSEDAQLRLFFQSFFGSEKFLNNEEFAAFKEKKVRYVRHQLAHAALATIASGFKECSFLTLDGGGDAGDKTDSIFGKYSTETGFSLVGGDEQIQNGLGAFHTALTRTIGFSLMEDGKATGIAAYGSYNEDIAKIMLSHLEYSQVTNRVTFTFKRDQSGHANFSKFKSNSYNRWKVWKSAGYESDFSRELNGFNSLDIARTGEQVLVDYAKLIVSELIDRTKQPLIALSGGVFQNVFLNSEIAKMEEIVDVFVPMAPNDAGLSLGAALYVLDELRRETPEIVVPRKFSAFLGPEFTDKEIEEELKLWPVGYSAPEDISISAAAALLDGKISGWFQGKQELGPRALGSRSVLGNPLLLEIKAKVNQVLKKRDWFMPYAPSCLYERREQYFEKSPHAPFMSFALTPNKTLVDPVLLQNISHVDGTSRAQFVEKSEAPLYHDMILNFAKLTGVPIVLNTSFNRHGIATISTPKQAIEHLVCGNVDKLFIGKFQVWPLSPVHTLDYKIVPEDIEILMISLEPHFSFFAGKTHNQPQESLTLQIYLGKLKLQLLEGYISGKGFRFELSRGSSACKIELIKYIEEKLP